MIGAIHCLILNEARERRLLPLWDRRGHSSEWIAAHPDTMFRLVLGNALGSADSVSGLALAAIDPVKAPFTSKMPLELRPPDRTPGLLPDVLH